MSAQGGPALGREGGEEGPIWINWTDSRAPHVEGRYTAREFDGEAKAYEPQRVEATCKHEGCKAELRVWCDSGRPREKLATFMMVHLHRDPFRTATLR